MMKIGLIVLTVFLGIALLSAAPWTKGVGAGEAGKEGDRGATAKSLNTFAVESYGRLVIPDSNLFFSPFSIYTVFAMVYGGARGNTAHEIEKVFRFPKTGTELHEDMAVLRERVEATGRTGAVKLRTANSLWPQDGYPFLLDYLKLVERHYKGHISPLDFRRDEKGARSTINSWVEEKTEQKIVNLIKPGMIDALTRMVLVNAIYFKGDWQDKFDTKNTVESQFFLLSGSGVKAPLMMIRRQCNYGEFPLGQILELPYAGGDVSMIVVLPGKADGLPDIEKGLSQGRLEEWIRSMGKREVIVYLPRFKAISEFRLDKMLMSMGMADAFTPERADLSGMDGQKGNLFIGMAVHKAYVDVNEEGTEAAAATAAGIRMTSMPAPPPVFRADHPFLFMIRHNPSGTILFMGRLVDPLKNLDT